MEKDQPIQLTSNLRVTPLKVPHRDEFSETVGFRVETGEKSLLFIPDIDKWPLWDKDIRAEVAQVDLALLDAIGQRRGCMVKGGIVDLTKAGTILITELRSGLFGPISLETPDMVTQELADAKLEQARIEKEKAEREKERARKAKKKYR